MTFQKQYFYPNWTLYTITTCVCGGTEEYHINLSQNNQIIGEGLNLQAPKYVAWKLTI
jgi:hypothetical protein